MHIYLTSEFALFDEETAINTRSRITVCGCNEDVKTKKKQLQRSVLGIYRIPKLSSVFKDL